MHLPITNSPSNSQKVKHSLNTFSEYTHSLNTYILTIHTFSQYICSLSTYMLSKHTFSQYLHSLNTVWVNLKVPEFLVIVRERVHLCRLATLWAAVLLSWEPHWGIILLFCLHCVMQAYWRRDCALPDFTFETLKCQSLPMSYHGAVVLEWS